MKVQKRLHTMARLQQQTRQQLILAYIITILVISFSVSIVLFFLYSEKSFWQDTGIIALFTMGYLGLIHRTIRRDLAEGNNLALETLKVTLVDEHHSNPILQRYYTLAVRLVDAVGIKPMPKLGFIPTESINAMTLSSTSRNALILLTEGALTQLSEKALEGLIARELAQIIYGNDGENFKRISWLETLQTPYLYGRKIYKASRGNYPKALDQYCLGYSAVEHEAVQPLIFMSAFVLVAAPVLLMGIPGALLIRRLKTTQHKRYSIFMDEEASRMLNHKALAHALNKMPAAEQNRDDYEAVNLRHTGLYNKLSHLYAFDYHYNTDAYNARAFIYERVRLINPSVLGQNEQAPVLAAEAPVAAALSQYEASKKKGHSSQQQAAARVLEQSNYALNHNIASCYTVLLASATQEAVVRKLKLLKPHVSPGLYRIITNNLTYKVGPYDEQALLNYLLASMPGFTLSDQSYVDQFRAGVNLLIHEDNQVSLFEYCVWRILTQYVAGFGQNAVETLAFDTVKRTVVAAKNEVSLLVNLIVNVAFTNSLRAEQCYKEQVAAFASTTHYQANIEDWQQILETIIPVIKQITPAGHDFLGDLLEELYELPDITLTGKWFIHGLCIILALRLPKAIWYRDGNDADIKRIEIYR